MDLIETPSLEDIPEEFDGNLDCNSLAICCTFNRHGTLIAVGCNDGRVVIWDFLTRGVAKNLLAHAGHPVSSVSWSRNGQKLVSVSLDNSVAIWQVLTGTCLIRWRLNSPLTKVQFNPRNDNLILVSAFKHPAILLFVDYSTSFVKCQILQTDKEDQDSNVVASFDRRGKHIYTGNSKGKITIFECPAITLQDKDIESNLPIKSSFKISPNAPTAIREIEFGARNKKFFLVNSSDKSIRMYTCEKALKAGINGTCEEERRFQDNVNRNMWKRCCLSGDADASHVCGGSARENIFYFWDTENGTIKKILEGNKSEILLDVQWHPHKPIVVSISNGVVSIWARAQIENWSAYAPDFRELKENEEYEERESEFDLEDEDKEAVKIEKDSKNNETDVFVDVEGIDKNDCLVSSDEEGVDPSSLEYIPITFDFEKEL